MGFAAKADLHNTSVLATIGREWIERLLGATSLDVFFERHWERRHLYIPARQSSSFDALLTPDELDSFLSRNDVRYPAIQIVKGGRNVPLGEYARLLRIGSYSSDGLIDMDLVRQSYRNGGTIIIQLMQNSFVRVADFSNALSAFFHSKIDVHGFLTPPKAQGLSAHYDAASAFLIQLRGAKRWRLYEMEIEAPAPDQTFDARNPIKGKPIDEITMRPGDVVYFPKGLPHEGLTLENESLHLTIVLFPKSWIEILSSVLRECQKAEEFRKAPIDQSLLSFDKKHVHDWSALIQQFTEQARSGSWKKNLEIPQVPSPLSRRGRWTDCDE